MSTLSERTPTPPPPALERQDQQEDQPPEAPTDPDMNQPPAVIQPPAATDNVPLNVNAPPFIDQAQNQNVNNQNMRSTPQNSDPTIPHGAGVDLGLPVVNPEDSASNISKGSNRSKFSTLSAIKLKNNQKQIELKLQLAALHESNQIEEEKRLIQIKAEQMTQRQKEIVLRAKLQAAREVNDMIDLESSEVKFKTMNLHRSFEPVEQSPIENTNCYGKQKEDCEVPATFSSGTPSSELLTIFNKLIETQKDQALPNQDIEAFDGTDILNYFTFVKNFELIVERHTDDFSRRLEFLLKYTKGEANELIKFTPLINDPKAAYTKARELLHRDYGDPNLMAQEFMNRAESWNKIASGDKNALRKFSIFLVNCVNSKQNNPDMTSLDGFDFIKTLCQKLPVSIQQKWKSENGRIRDHFNRSPNLLDFEHFVNLMSRNENDPRVSGLGYQKSTHNHNQQVKHVTNTPQKKVYTTQVKRDTNTGIASSSVAPCLFCGEGTKHNLLECRKFTALSPSDKSDFVRKRGMCYGCLNPGHMKDKCQNVLNCDLCPRKHPTVLHDTSKDKKQSTDHKTLTSTHAVAKNSVNSSEPLMAILPVKVKSPVTGHQINTYAFLDNGFSSVFITDELTNVLQLRSKTVDVSVKTVNNIETVKTGHITDEILVSDLKGDNSININSAYIRKSIPVNLEDAPTQSDLNKWKHLKEIEIPTLSGLCIPSVSIMIGISVPSASTPLELVTGNLGDPYAVRSPLGWLFYGLPGKLVNVRQTAVNYCQLDSKLEDQVRHYFNLEFSERLCDQKLYPSSEDKQFVKIMDESVSIENGHYKTKLPFRDSDIKLPNNKSQAEMYAHRLRKRLTCNQSLHEQYVKFMDNLELSNYCEQVPSEQLNRDDGRVWYIPHHPVTHPKKPGKVRVVFNCPVTYNQYSLNGLLLQGPDYANRLLSVLLRWRENYIAVMADIECMFYQVRVSDNDCDMLRFLWWPKGNLEGQIVEYRMLVHLFGAISSPSCCNYILKRVAIDNENHVDQTVIDSIKNDFYVDDFLKSIENESKTIDLVKDLKQTLKSGGFNLTKWVSNSKNVLRTIPEVDRVEETKNLDFDNDNLPAQRALGVKWLVDSDKIQFSVSAMDPKATRRNILSVMSSVYDPFGIASPYVLRSKIILQELCRQKLSWDQDIPSKQQKDWESWLNDLSNLEHFSVDRCIKPELFGKIVNTQLHHFADASQDAYATVSYVRFENELGEVHVSFLLGRSRVAPIRPHTIVKLELSAATSIVRMNNMLNSELSIPIDSVVFWTDSQTILRYIANEKLRHQVFVSNRLAIIRDGSNIDQWRYVPSKQNPADHGSRGLSAQALTLENWMTGPEFLRECRESWPENPVFCETSENIVNVNVVKLSETTQGVINKFISHYSDWIRLKRGVSWLLRFKNILRLKARNREISDDLMQNSLSNDEVSNAENAILKYVQITEFSEEYQNLCDNVSNVKYKSSLADLDPVLINELICVGGRLRNATIPDYAKNQIVLPKSGHVSELIARFCHKKVGHQGRNHSLAEIRQHYWIIRAGVLVKNLVRNCVMCRRLNSRAGQQKMADLPFHRVQPDKGAFSSVGVDFFGPFEIKVGRSLKKRYGVIFTCFSTRAIHIEVANSLDTSSCVDAIRRFIARRGVPKDFFSDNGTNLVSANKELQQSIKELDLDTLNHFGVKLGFQWHFNTPTASHHGGVWERQIRTIRKILQSILGEQFLRTSQTEEQLQTLMCEVESIINSRPLTRVSEDSSDLSVITPNSLLLLQPVMYPPGTFVERDIYAKRRWRQIQYLATLFWKRWTREYLPMLQQRQKWFRPQRNFEIGDIVIIVDDNLPRYSWPLGKIIETYPNKQGLVRSVKIRTETSMLVRPIDKICLLLEQDE